MLSRPYTLEEDEYYIHKKTTNMSFMKVATLLHMSGIDNYDFFLKLYDKDLMHIDPYDPDITFEEMSKVVVEVSRNYWYFLREIARIPEEGASTEIGGGTPFLLHRGNLAQAWCFEHNLSHYLELPRQFGKTTGAVQRYLWQFNFNATSSTTIFMNMDKAASVSNLARLKESRALLPLYLQFNKDFDEKTGELKSQTDNVNEIKNKRLGNKILTKASARNTQNAERAGRGLTVASLWFDELGHMLFNEVIHAAAMPAFSRASENAAKNNKPYGVCITSTPGDLGTTHGDYAFTLIKNAAPFTESLYDEDADFVDTWLRKNSSNKMVYIKFSFIQLGKTMDWYTEQCENLNNNWVKIRRELLLQWNKASNNSPFSAEDIEALVETAVEPIDTLRINGHYFVDIYKKLDPFKRYLVGVDVSKGVGKDATAVAIVDSDTLDLVALFQNNTMRSPELKRFLYTLMMDHLPNSVLVIESNYVGSAVIEDLLRTPLKNFMYYDFAYRLAEENRKNGVIKAKNRDKLVYGHEVTAATRPKMMDLLLQFVSKYKSKIACRDLVEQIRHLEYKNEERIDHQAGKHDDAVFAYLACIYTMFHGRNLSRFGLFNKYNFDGDEMEEREYNQDDVLDKVLRKTKFAKMAKNNPYLSGLFEDLLFVEDLQKQSQQELWELEADDASGSIFTTDGHGMNKVMKPNAIAMLNARAAVKLDRTTNSIFGLSDRYNGGGW